MAQHQIPSVSIDGARPTLRGEGLVYSGSLVEFHGETVAWIEDCNCPACAGLDEWDPARRYIVRLDSGATLACCGAASLTGRG